MLDSFTARNFSVLPRKENFLWKSNEAISPAEIDQTLIKVTSIFYNETASFRFHGKFSLGGNDFYTLYCLELIQ